MFGLKYFVAKLVSDDGISIDTRKMLVTARSEGAAMLKVTSYLIGINWPVVTPLDEEIKIWYRDGPLVEIDIGKVFRGSGDIIQLGDDQAVLKYPITVHQATVEESASFKEEDDISPDKIHCLGLYETLFPCPDCLDPNCLGGWDCLGYWG